MKSISEMQRQSANVNMPEKAGSIADAFCRAYYAAGAVERALGTHAPDRGTRMAMAAARVMQIANLLDADLQPEIERKIARNRRRVYKGCRWHNAPRERR